MSVNYAAGLSAYENKGKCGLPEFQEGPESLEAKIDHLADIVRDSKHMVVHTGAGVSTAAGIPDFRGPKGVWTLEKQGIEPCVNVTFDDAKPTFTHMALRALEERGFVKFLITQNIDGLHLRSGFARDRLAELHGNMFIEQCQTCRQQHIRSCSVATIGQKLTGAVCLQKKESGRLCRGKLRDVVLDWEDNLPEFELAMSEHHSRLADVSLCLGTTLQIVPAGSLPLKCKKNGGKLVIVNLQQTKHHAKADLVIHAKVDQVLRQLLQRLDIICPDYVQPEIVLHSVNGAPELAPQLLPNKRKRQSDTTTIKEEMPKRKFEPSEEESSKTEENGTVSSEITDDNNTNLLEPKNEARDLDVKTCPTETVKTTEQ